MWVSGLKTMEEERQEEEACMNENITLNQAGFTCRDVRMYGHARMRLQWK